MKLQRPQWGDLAKISKLIQLLLEFVISLETRGRLKWRASRCPRAQPRRDKAGGSRPELS